MSPLLQRRLDGASDDGFIDEQTIAVALLEDVGLSERVELVRLDDLAPNRLQRARRCGSTWTASSAILRTAPSVTSTSMP